MSHKLGALAALQCYSDSDDEDEGVESCLVNGKDNVVDVDNDVKQCNQPPSKTPALGFCPVTLQVKCDPERVNDCAGVSSSDEEEYYELPPAIAASAYRNAPSDSETDSSSSDESVLTTSVLDVDEHLDDDHSEDVKVPRKLKMLADLGITDLLPIQDLTITVPKEECIPVGKIFNIIEELVIVKAARGTPALDFDTVLFLDRGQNTLGHVFDIFGQVTEPMYMVRFNSPQHIIDKGVKVDDEVYFAPRTKHTAFVFLDPLMKMKGSDASWEGDTEPPPSCIDYSDDEEERRAKQAQKFAKQGAAGDSIPTPAPKKGRASRSGSRGRGPRQKYHANPFYLHDRAVPSTSQVNLYPSQTNMFSQQVWTGNRSQPSWQAGTANLSLPTVPHYSNGMLPPPPFPQIPHNDQ